MTVNINELSKNLIQRFVKKSSDDSLISLARGDIKKAKKDLDGADKAKKLLKKPINELSKDTLNKFITKALEKNAQNYVSGQVNKNIIQKHVKYTKVAHAKIEKKDQAELKKIMGESSVYQYIKNLVKRNKVNEIADVGTPASKNVPYGYYVVVKSLKKLGSGPHPTFGDAEMTSGGNPNHVVVKHIGGGKFHKVDYSDDKGRPYKGEIFDKTKLDDYARNPIHEDEIINETWKYLQYPSRDDAKKARDAHFNYRDENNMRTGNPCRHIGDGKLAYKGDFKGFLPPKKIKEDEAPTNAMGDSSSTQGPIQTFDPLLGAKKKKKILKRSIPKEI